MEDQKNNAKPVLILGAMKGEIAAYLKLSQAVVDQTWNKTIFYRGEISHRSIILSCTGVGKSMAAMTTQKAIDLFQPSHILFTGLAGALHPEYQIGDIVLGRESIMYDMDASSLGFARGEIPYAKIREILGDTKILSIASNYVSESQKIHIGRILTGDLFVNTDYKNKLRQNFDGDAVEMEGASVGLVAMYNQIPHLLIRIISDQADGRAKIDFQRFLPEASAKLAYLLQYILEKI